MAERRNKTIRDMSISMGVVIIGVLVVVGLYGGFSFSPGAPSGGTQPTADVVGGFSTAGRQTDFVVVVPQAIPAQWHASSYSITKAGTPDLPPTVRGGWQTPSGFISLAESSGPVAAVLTVELGDAGSATSSVMVGGARWDIGPGRRAEVAWVRTVKGVTLLITGDASAADFTVLATAVAA